MDNLNFKVDKEKCLKCGLCIKNCTSKNLKPDNDGVPYSKKNSCLGCQQCMAICPACAISVFDKSPENSVKNENLPTSEQMEILIKTRRSCRLFKHENISPKIMEKLKNILNWTPTGCNFKDLHFTVVEDYNKMDSIKERIYKKLKFLIKYLPIKGRLNAYKNAILSGQDMIFRNAPHMIIVSVNKKAPCKNIDPTIALSYFELYAHTLNIGTLWCGLAFGTLPLRKDVMKELQIPKTHKMAYVMLFGYPDVNFKRGIQPEKYNMTEIK